MPQVGEKVYVWPEPGMKVEEMPGRFLPDKGKDVVWSPFLERIYTRGGGVLHLTDPRPQPKAPAAPEPAPAAPTTSKPSSET